MSKKRDTKGAKSSPPGPVESTDEPQNLERVRDLLFGSQLKDVDNKLEQVEDRLLREIGDLREAVHKRSDSFEQFVKKELETLSGRITSEQETRDAATGELKTALRDSVESFEKRAAQLNSALEQNAKDIREQLLEQTKLLTQDVLQKHNEALQMIQKSADQIRSEHVDRSDLSRMFTELAVRLNTNLAGALLSGPEEDHDD